jgi:PST family polysaccharide transporter
LTLTRSTLGALRWNALGTVVRVASQLLVGIVLARILGPEPFGLVAAALLFISVGLLLQDLGLGSAIVQASELDERDIRFAFTVQMLVAILATAVVALGASLIATLLRVPQLATILPALSVQFLLQGFGATSSALLRRDLHFKSVQIAQTLSYVIGYVAVGIPMAFGGYAVWSLVTAQLVQSGLQSIILYARAPHSVAPTLRSSNPKLGRFGLGVLLTNLTNWSISSLDSAYIARFLGAVPLGLYNRAFLLTGGPALHLIAVLQGVLFPAYSRTDSDLARIRRGYLTALLVVGAILLPSLGIAAAIPSTLVEGLYGPQWSAAAPVITPLALAMILLCLTATAGPTLWATGRIWVEFRIQVVVAIMLALGAYFAVSRGIAAVAWLVAIVSFIRGFAMNQAALRLLGGSWGDFWMSMRAGLAIGVVAASVALLQDVILGSRIPGATTRLLIELAVSGGIAVFFGVASWRWLVPLPLVPVVESLGARFFPSLGRRAPNA